MANEEESELFKELFSKPDSSVRPFDPDPGGSELLDVSPRLIPGYELIWLLGKGGMGCVYRARQLSLDRIVAIKLLNPDLSGDQEYVGRFLIEARTAGKLRHLNIVSAIECGRVKETHFMVMEFIEGKPLDATLKELGILNERVALQIIKQVAEGLDYAWRHGIVHRDIKPLNIMMTQDGTAKICDLGLCKSVRRDVNLTSTGYINCTPTHASPEQARGDKAIDCGTDIYSLGVTFYQLVTGTLPFKGTSTADYIVKHATAPRVPPHERNPKVSRAVSDLILKMIEPDRKNRPGTPGEVVEAIRNILATPGKPKPVAAQKLKRKPAIPAGELAWPSARAETDAWQIRVTDQDGFAIVRVVGRLDDSFDREVTRALSCIVEKGVTGIVVDLSGLDYMNSLGVSAFVAIVDDVREKGGDLKLVGAKPQAKLVLERLGITLIIQHLSTVDEAIEAFRTTPIFGPPKAEVVIDLPPESIVSSEGPVTSHPETVTPNAPLPIPPEKSSGSQEEKPAVRHRLQPASTDHLPGAVVPGSSNRKLIAILVAVAMFLALTCIALAALLVEARRKRDPQSGEPSPPAPAQGAAHSATPAERAGPDAVDLALQMEALRKLADSSPNPSAVIDRCNILRPQVLATFHLEELETISARADSLLASRRDRFLLEIEDLIRWDPEFRRKVEIFSMLDAAINSFDSKDARFHELRNQHQKSLQAAAQASLLKAMKAQADGASVSDQLTLYTEAARLAEGSSSHAKVATEVGALQARARLLIPEELIQLKAQIGRLVPDDFPAAHRLAKQSELRYPLAEWVDPVREEADLLWNNCWRNFQLLLEEAKRAVQRGDRDEVNKLRDRLSKWEIPTFLGEFDKALTGGRQAFLGIEADLKRAVPSGLALAKVIPGGAAERAGIKAGDIVLQLDEQKVSTFDEFRAVILKKSAGDKVKVKVKRENKELEFECELGLAPEK